MTFILKRPHTNDKNQFSRGCIIFKASELTFLTQPHPWCVEATEALAQQYLFGIYWPSYRENIPTYENVAFHVAGPTTIMLADGNHTPWLPFSTRNFLPALFQPDDSIAPYWDIAWVANATYQKHLPDFLKVLKQVYQRRPQTKTLMICPEPVESQMDSAKWYTELPTDFERLFTADERANIDLMRVKRHQSLYPVTPDTIAYFLKASRVFTLFSKREGTSRVISEALMTNTPVVARRELSGGGLDYLNDSNSRLFSTLDEAANSFIELLENPLTIDTTTLADAFSETVNIPKFEAGIKQVYNQLHEPFFGPLATTNLYRNLPGHANLLPREMVDPATMVDDVGTHENYLKLVDYLLGTHFHATYGEHAKRHDARIQRRKQRLHRFDSSWFGKQRWFKKRLRPWFVKQLQRAQ